jgi:DNA-binding XRE family transcriptional regulator
MKFGIFLLFREIYIYSGVMVPKTPKHFGRQVEAARALLRWSRATLADRACISPDTILRLELGRLRPHQATVAQIIRVLDDCGVVFVDDRDGFGVKLLKRGLDE